MHNLTSGLRIKQCISVWGVCPTWLSENIKNEAVDETGVVRLIFPLSQPDVGTQKQVCVRRRLGPNPTTPGNLRVLSDKPEMLRK